ncbi:MAG: DUF2326 domain-containing protein [Lentisphaeraceae bacterium]|nr:DUF2326 domain-containing protein [Lentisphaeraceae bacterium]
MEIEHSGKSHIISRSVKNKSKVMLNGEEKSIGKLREFLNALCFTIPDNTNNLTWSTLFAHFIRTDRSAYVKFSNAGNERQPFQEQINNAFLLGLDLNLVLKKQQLKKQWDSSKNLKKNFEDDELIRKFLIGNKDLELGIFDLQNQIHSLQGDLNKFQVAEDYHEVKKDADAIEKELLTLTNKETLVAQQIENLIGSLNTPADLSKEKIKTVYEEAIGVLPQKVTKQLDDLELFHKRLSTNRVRRLSEQKIALEEQLSELEKNIRLKNTDFDKKLQYIGAHDSLDVFVKMSTKLGDLKAQLASLDNYQKLLDEYTQTIVDIRAELLRQTSRTASYLTEIKEQISEDISLFRSFAKKFYPNSVAGLSVKNNEGENQLRFDFDAHIDSDGSDGINNVKIFCYDATILKARHRHKIDFIFHDSRIFDGVENRQLSQMIELISDEFQDQQYIASINEYHLQLIEEILGKDKVQELVHDYVILELTDDSENGKILGIQVDLKLS